MGTNPLFGFLRTLLLLVTGQVHFDRRSKGKRLAMADGAAFEVFRHVKIGKDKGNRPPKAVFVVRFKPRMSVKKNIGFSLLPMLIILGFRGFREKYWAVDRSTGLCQGLYWWQTVEDAKDYSNSVAMRFMASRSDPESVWFEILDESQERFSAFTLGESGSGRRHS